MSILSNKELYYRYRKKYILELNIYQHQIDKASEKSQFKTNNSITDNKNNIYGILGEIVFGDLFKIPQSDRLSTKDYDLIFLGQKVDIKTKKTTVVPSPEYNFSIATTSLHQSCDAYVGMRISEDMKKAYLLGYITKKDFMTGGVYGVKGDVEENSSNNFTYQADCMNIPIAKMSVIDVGILDYLQYNYEIKDENDIYFSTQWFEMEKSKYRILLNKMSNKVTVQNDKRINKLDIFCSDAYTFSQTLKQII